MWRPSGAGWPVGSRSGNQPFERTVSPYVDTLLCEDGVLLFMVAILIGSYNSLTPTGTTSTSGVMMGLGSTIKFTPSSTGNVRITITGVVYSTGTGTNDTNVGMELHFGTGTAPANGAAPAGTLISTSWSMDATTGQGNHTFVVDTWKTGFSTGTTYWLDLKLWTGNSSYTAHAWVLTYIVEEI